LKTLRTYLFVMLALLAGSGYAQLSPGDLTDAHAKWEGMSNCTQCHDLGNKVTNAKCLNCHKEMKSLISKNQGFHASKEVKGQDCFKCHSEHHGRKFEMVRFDEKAFDHGLTGYKLEGAHKPIDAAIATSRTTSRIARSKRVRAPSSEWMRHVFRATRISTKAPCPVNV